MHLEQEDRLSFFEANFDANVFALIGNVEFDRDPRYRSTFTRAIARLRRILATRR